MRQIAERLLPDAVGTTYVDREIVNQKLKPLSLPTASFHIYCSKLNPGAKEIMMEVSGERKFDMLLESKVDRKGVNKLHVTTEAANLENCDHMMLYLTGQTWTRGAPSEALGEELMKAMDLQVNVLLVHEMPGVGGQEARFGCEFGSFFSCADGETPEELLARGIYSSIAVPLKGGAWREASMVLLGLALGMSKEEEKDAEQGIDILSMGGPDAERLARSLKRVVSLSNLAAPMSLASSSWSKVKSFGEESIRKRSSGRLATRRPRPATSTTTLSMTTMSVSATSASADREHSASPSPILARTPQLTARFDAGPLGITIGAKNGTVQVISVDADSQAHALGVVEDSVILEVAGQSVEGLSKSDVMDRMKQAVRPVELLLASELYASVSVSATPTTTVSLA